MITLHHVVTLAFMIFFVFLVVPALPAHAEESSSLRGFRGAMIRRAGTYTSVSGGAAINFTQAARDSRRRLAFLAARRSRVDKQFSASQHLSNNETVPLRMDSGGGAYDMEFAIGTPPQKLTALADTGSDLIWARCGASSSYNPTASSTFAKLPCSDRLCTTLMPSSRAWCGAGGGECDYKYAYGLGGGDHYYTQGFLGTETFTLGGDAAPGVGFGCTTASEGQYGEDNAGLVGLGRGPLSLVSQLGAGAFMYCLIRDASEASPLLFGSLATLPPAVGGAGAGAGVQSTGLLDNATFYAVDLLGITIGSETTAGVGAANGGVVFDSGTTLTYLADPAYSDARDAFLSQTTGLTRVSVGIRDGFEACFEKPAGKGFGGAAVPAMVLHFAGGADMALPVENYLVEVYDGVVCWVVQKSPSTSIIGNLMQTNYLVLHDVRRSLLSFKPANCDSYKMNEASGSLPRPLDQFFITTVLLLCFYIY